MLMFTVSDKLSFFFFNDTATTEIYTLSLHDALPIFVVGYAYDDRWHSMSTWNFFKRRLVRLHPMVVFGATLGLFLFYFAEGESFPLIGQTEWYMLLGVYVLGCLMIPTPPSMDVRGWSETYSLNGPAWSLMYEYVANILYALFVRRLSKTALAVCVAIFGILTLNLCLNFDVTSILKPHEWEIG